MPHGPLVSIGILSYNRPVELRYAIESVIGQSYANLEILISDNGSQNPETLKVIAEYAAKDSRVKAFYHQINKGPQFNFRFLVAQASGEFFSWLADDDAYSPRQIEQCVETLLQHPHIVVAANRPVLAQTGEPMPLMHIPHTVGLPLAEKYTKTVHYLFNDPNLLYYGLIRLDALRKCKYYLKKIFGGDLLLLLELLAFGDIAINADLPGYVYTFHADQTSSSPLRYKTITTQHSAEFFEKHTFFSAFIVYMMRIIRHQKGLDFSQQAGIIRLIVRYYFSTKRFHLVKYDLHLDGLFSFIRRARKSAN